MINTGGTMRKIVSVLLLSVVGAATAFALFALADGFAGPACRAREWK
jgi:hypothetical protein